MENAMVKVIRWPGNWSPVTEKTVTFLEAVHWFSKHHYTARAAHKTADGRRYLNYERPGCKTTYQMIILSTGT